MSALPGPSKPVVNAYRYLPSNGTQKTPRLNFVSEEPFTPKYLKDQLSISKNLNANALYELRVKGRHLLLESQSGENGIKKPNEQRKLMHGKRRERRKLKLISRKEAELKGLWRLEENQRRYELFIPLHHLWLGYMSELLGLAKLPLVIPKDPLIPNVASIHPKLVKADYHGSLLSVKQAKNPCLIGISGIVIHETENAFRVITQKNQVKLLPKQGVIFSLCIPLYDVRPVTGTKTVSPEGSETQNPIDFNAIPQMVFELYGNQFRFRAADRAGKKFKTKNTIEL